MGIEDIDDRRDGLAKFVAQPGQRGHGGWLAGRGECHDFGQPCFRSALLAMEALECRAGQYRFHATAPTAVTRRLFVWNRIMSPLARDAVPAIEHMPPHDNPTTNARAQDQAKDDFPPAPRAEHRFREG